MKKPHMLRWAQSPRIDVLKRTPSLVDFSPVSPLRLFDQPALGVFFHYIASHSNLVRVRDEGMKR
jgi:hypothetical protein